MRFASLGSGSRGNGTLVESAGSCLLVDCGFSICDTERRMARLGRSPAELAAILVTHEHSDHIKGVMPLARKYSLPVYASQGTAAYQQLGKADYYRKICLRQPFAVGDLAVIPVAVPHDAREPCQFVIKAGKKTFGLLTDLGSITPFVCEQYRDCDALMLECNHDSRMLATGPYPEPLKRRVGGAWGHLNNRQAADFLQTLDTERLQHLVLSHISDKNNTEALARAAIAEVFTDDARLQTADQALGTEWLAIA